MRDTETYIKFGKFSVASGRDVYGELRVAGEKSLLYLRDDEFFQIISAPEGYITGTLHDLTKVTLLQCIAMETFGTGLRGGERYHYAKLFPHFVLEGGRHLGANERAIVEIRIVIEDAPILFYDFDAFGTAIDAVPHIERVVKANELELERFIPIGPDPQIAYFGGKRIITETNTVLGKVRVQHNPAWTLAGPRGVRIDNTITVNIETECLVTFEEAIDRTQQILRFLELIIGRPQNLHNLVIILDSCNQPEPLKVHWSYCPSRDADSTDDKRSPHPADLLLDPICRPDEFAGVMSAWFEKDKERHDARQRFHTSFANQHRYSIERLVGAANMFDILPKSAVPWDVELPTWILDAKQHCRAIFKALPECYERDSVLSALGRLGKASLKHKTRHRAQYVMDTIGERFPDLVFVLDEAVNCRNHYVHGSVSKIDYSQHFNMVTFFTDTLEFVFAASELIEAGWNIRTFIGTPTTMSHPFGAYRVNYDTHLRMLKELIA